MVGLLKLLVFVGAFAGFVWWGVTVPLGERTLFGHLRAIGQSKESQELVRGTKETVGHLKKKIAEEEGPGDEGAAAKAKAAAVAEEKAQAEAPPQEKITSAERKEMRRLIGSARAKATQ